MLLNEYLNRFRKGIQKIEDYGYADSIDIREEIRANKQAILNVKVVLINQYVLHIKEYLDAKYRINRVSYAYQYQDRTGRLIFRYDNAAHRRLSENSNFFQNQGLRKKLPKVYS